MVRFPLLARINISFLGSTRNPCVRKECVLPEIIRKLGYHIHQGQFIYRLPQGYPIPPLGVLGRSSNFQLEEDPRVYPRNPCCCQALSPCRWVLYYLCTSF